jgi:four helix bundle protein
VNTIAELPNCGITELNPDTKSIQLKEHTKTFANRVIRLFDALPKKTTAFVLGKQALRSGTSVAADCRAACRSRSKAEFISRIGILTEEADETVLWLS